MALKHRSDGLPFTCENAGYKTNTNQGEPHGTGMTKGSVFVDPLIEQDSGYTLWLEYVTEKKSDAETFWFMWYDTDGSPTIPLSGVFDIEQIREMTKRLADFLRLP